MLDPPDDGVVAEETVGSAVEAALRRWGMSSPPDGLAAMSRRWPGIVCADLEADVRPRIAQLDFLVNVSAISGEAAARLAVDQPRALGNYAVHALWEQDGLIAVNKPYDMRIDFPKGEGPRWPEERTVADWFSAKWPGERVRFCHQLDHATSGVMLMASTKVAGRIGSQLFEKREARKTYLALVLGCPPWTGEKRLTDRLTDGDGFARRIASSDEPGEEAETLARVVQRGSWPASIDEEGQVLEPAEPRVVQAALVEVRLVTGRRHQIRLHLAAAGYPVLGDDTYGGHPWGDRSAAYRMFLHAYRLVLPLPPSFGSTVATIEAPCCFEAELGAPVAKMAVPPSEQPQEEVHSE